MKTKREDYTPGKPTVAVILEKRRPKSDNTLPVTLRVTHNRKSKYYSLKEYATQSLWDSMFEKRPPEDAKRLRKKVDTWKEKADIVLESLPVFTFDHFEKMYFEASRNEKDVFAAYDRAIEEYRKAGRESTAVAYECSRNAVRRFADLYYSGVLEFKHVTPGFLKKFEEWWKGQNLSITSVGIYLRSLRALYNRAIFEKVVSRDLYPFGRRLYVIPKGKNIKKALTLEEIGRIYNYQANEGSREQFARDIWMFSYFCWGMNMTDIARLKYKNLVEDKIVYTRKKTEHTNAERSQIVIPISIDIGRIIDKWSVKPSSPDQYLFNILIGYKTAGNQLSRIKDVTKSVNKHINNIATKLEINKHVTTYSARHSMATVLKRSGVSVDLISELLDHSDVKTTASYIDSIETNEKLKLAELLTAFEREVENEK